MKKRRDEIEWSKMTEEQLEIIDYYCRDNMRQLKRICDPIIRSHNLPNMYYEDLYTIAVDTIGKSLFTYDETKSQFETYLVGNLKRKFNSWIRDNTRGCRCNVLRDENGKIVKDENGINIVISNISFDVPSEDEIDLKEKIDSKFNIENVKSKDIFSIEDSFDDFCPKMKNYIRGLSKMQIRILEYLQNGYIEEEIVYKLNITIKTYRDCLNGIKSERNTRKIYSLIRRK